MTYTLKPGTYLVGDPAMIIKKTGEAIKISQALWDVFYQDPQSFQQLTVDGITFLITRTAEGDGIYNGVGTDTGTIMIIDTIKHQFDERLNLTLDRRGMLTLRLLEEVTVYTDRFNLYFSNGINIITNSDDM